MSTETASTDRSPKRQPARRVWEWFWRGNAVRAARASASAQRHLEREAQRARIALEVGEKTLDPAGPWEMGSAAHLAAGLFAESIGRSLRLLKATRAADDQAEIPLAPPTRLELEALVKSEQDPLLAAAGDTSVLDRVTQALLMRTFESESLPDADARIRARELGRVAAALATWEPSAGSAVDRLLAQRVLRLGALAVMLAACWFGGLKLRELRERRGDLSIGKSWVASSSYEEVCQSPSRDCNPQKSYFFHTQNEAQPWLEIDLGAPRTVSGVHVFNRRDCCTERAVPLIVEASSDKNRWQELARRTEVFDDWRATFKPTSARWVRFRAARQTILHLHDVRVLP